jgi:hypothetical protein
MALLESRNPNGAALYLTSAQESQPAIRNPAEPYEPGGQAG